MRPNVIKLAGQFNELLPVDSAAALCRAVSAFLRDWTHFLWKGQIWDSLAMTALPGCSMMVTTDEKELISSPLVLSVIILSSFDHSSWLTLWPFSHSFLLIAYRKDAHISLVHDTWSMVCKVIEELPSVVGRFHTCSCCQKQGEHDSLCESNA